MTEEPRAGEPALTYEWKVYWGWIAVGFVDLSVCAYSAWTDRIGVMLVTLALAFICDWKIENAMLDAGLADAIRHPRP